MLAAVAVDFGAVHVGAGFRTQHIDDLGDLVRRAEPVHRNLLLDDLLGARRQDRGVDLARRDRVVALSTIVPSRRVGNVIADNFRSKVQGTIQILSER